MMGQARRRRVLLINIGYWPFVGGSQVYTQQIAERLVRDGHEVVVLTTDAADTEQLWRNARQTVPEAAGERGGVRIRRFPVRHLPLAPYSYYALRRLTIELGRLSARTNPIARRLAAFTPWVPGLAAALADRRERFDVVHAHSIPFESLMLAGWDYARRHDVPFLATPFMHIGDGQSEAVSKFYGMPHQLELLRRSDAVMTLTGIERDYLLARRLDPSRVTAVGAGVDPGELAGGDAERFRARFGVERPFAFYLGAVAFEKGARHAIEAMRQLWRDGLDADFVVAGALFQHMIGYLRSLPEFDRGRLHVLGPIAHQDKLDLLAAGKALVMPSRTESFGIAYLEAWCYGKPVIGARAGGVVEVIADGVDGRLVRFGDVPALAAAIADLLASPGLAAELGANGRAKVLEHYTWDHVYARVREVYGRALAGRPGAGDVALWPALSDRPR